MTANNQPRIASDVVEDPTHLKNEFLPETRSEIGVPISIGNLVLGALDVQSTQSNAFGPESSTVVMLQTLASQIASAIQNVELIEAAQINVQEVERLYRSTHLIAETIQRRICIGSNRENTEGFALSLCHPQCAHRWV